MRVAAPANRNARRCCKLNARSDRIKRALDHATRNLRASLSVEDLARAAQLSPRQFSRAFRAETGQSPARAVEQLRLEAARLMMEQTRHPAQWSLPRAALATVSGCAARFGAISATPRNSCGKRRVSMKTHCILS